MTLEEKFIFDLQGYIVVKNVLSQAEVDELNAIADQKMADQEEVSNGLKIPRRVSLWGKPFQNLFDHPNMIPYLSELLGPQFRADHDYGIFMRQGGRKGGLHGGDHRAGTHYYKYRDGVMRNGLTVVVYFLAPAPPGSGGFCCVPGSHKSNFALNVPEEVRSFKCIPHYLANPSAETGDALIFTEATMHGTLPWTAENERRTLLYKFTPGHVSYASIYYNHDDYEDLTEQQKRVLTPPSIRRPNVVETA